jgi:cytochrome c oxidase cbb3-type subunit 3
VAQGQAAFGTFCASCHDADGTGGKAGSVVRPAYLGLVSDQYLRTIVIAGRNDLGCPDFQNRVPGKPMSEEEISGVVAWLVSQRKNEFGQPLPLTQR